MYKRDKNEIAMIVLNNRLLVIDLEDCLGTPCIYFVISNHFQIPPNDDGTITKEQSM